MATEIDESVQAEFDAAASRTSGAMDIPVMSIEPSKVALRSVKRQTEAFQALTEAIRKNGVLNSILVRDLGNGRYGLIDGLQRWTASKDLGLATIPANVVDMDSGEALKAQIITNMSRIQTRPADLAAHLLRILASDPMMTKKSLAQAVCQSETWLDQRLSLTKLTPEIQKLVNEGKVHLTNAYSLTKLDEKEQADFLQDAMTLKPREFVPKVKARVKEVRDARTSGKDAGERVWQPTQHLKKIAIIKTEFAVLSDEADGDSEVLQTLQREGVEVTPEIKEAMKVAFAWLLHCDSKAIEAQKQAEEERQQMLAEKKERLKQEKERRKAEEAAEAAADATKGF